ncbi:MAG: signal peptidase II [Proteobacteria bacterium]|nr:signal peptidase II [Pseudomonadota bacterium]
MSRSWMIVAGAIALVCAVVDQIIKSLVVQNMALYDQIDLLPFFALYHTRNTGIAFSFLSGFSDTAMVVLTGAVMLFIGWLAVRAEHHQHLARAGFVLILGGALGNIVDRATLGYVIDYFLFHTPVWSFAVFNLADVFITVGAMFVILQEFLDWRRGRPATDR